MSRRNFDKSYKYSLPIKFNAKYDGFFKFGIIYFNICIAAFWYLILFYKPESNHDDLFGFLFIVITASIFLVLVLLLDIDFINSVFFRGQYVEINREGVTVKKLFKKKEVKWDEIGSVESYTFKMAKGIKITRKKPEGISKFRYTLGKGFGFFNIEINTRKYSTIDIHKFIFTIRVHGKI